MAISDADKKILKDLAHLVIDEAEPQIVADLVAKLPIQYQPVANLVVSSLNPALLKGLDAKLDVV